MPGNNTNEFKAAGKVVEALEGKDRDQQARILRWVQESLGLQAEPKKITTVTDQQPIASQPLPSTTPETSTDIRSFARSKNPSSDNQMAAVVAYYYQFMASEPNKLETINSSILSDAIRQIGANQPKDAGKTLNNAKNQGYLDLVGNGEYKVNSVGENLVVMTLGEGSSSEKNTTRKKKTSKKPASKKTSPKKVTKKKSSAKTKK